MTGALPTSRRDLDWQFNPRLACPEFDAIQSARRAESAMVADALGVERMPYGDDPREVVLRAGERLGEASPAVVFIHGGYWRAGDPSDNLVLAPALRELGAEALFLGYPLCPAASLPRLVASCRAGLGAIIERADDLGIDPGRIVLAGTSAGAHLAAMMLADASLSGRVAGAILISGIYDLTPVPLIGVNSEIGVTEADVAPFSPQFLPVRAVVPTIVAVGEREPPMWRAQSYAYAALARASGAPVETIDLAGRNHFDGLMELTVSGSPMRMGLARMLGGG